MLDNLEEFAQYEIIMTAFNDVGSSTPSPVALERTRESCKILKVFINKLSVNNIKDILHVFIIFMKSVFYYMLCIKDWYNIF